MILPFDPASTLPSPGQLPSQSTDLDWFETIPGERMAIHVPARAVDGAFSLVESLAAPGVATPIHVHREHELFLILSGTLTLSLNGSIVTAEPGNSVSVPPGMAHGWCNTSSTHVRFFAMFTPGGIDEMFRQWFGRDMPAIIDIAARHGTYVVGPPLY